jgi:chromobox protein 1/chromobox protein 3
MNKNEYEVEKILNHRNKNGRKQYLLKWAGYSIEESTWEDVENLNKCQNY